MSTSTAANLATNLTDAARACPDHAALRLTPRTVTYAELDTASAQLAAQLRLWGIGPGDRVGVMLPNVPEFAIAYYAILRVGGVVVPMNVLLKRREVAFYLSDSVAKLLIASEAFAGEASAGATQACAGFLSVPDSGLHAHLRNIQPDRAVTDRRGEDTAVILYTSGTTGTPKGAELTHANLARNVEVVVALFDLDAGDVVLGALPLFHSFGQTCGLNASIAARATLALVPRFDPARVLRVIQDDGVTVFEGVPTMYSALLNHPERNTTDCSSLRLCVSGGAALPVEILRGFEAAFGCVILEGYGLSETSPVACFNHPGRERVPGSIGTPIEGVEIQIVDETRCRVADGEVGEIAIRGHNVMKGYWRRPDETSAALDADGWFYTGDMARVDEQGRYFIVDRKKDLIIRGGYNVYPREVEEVLYEHPAVREAAVVGIPHAQLGEEVGAAVVLGAAVEVDELREFVRDQVAAYKYPRHIWIVEELPKGATGKILKREIAIPAAVTEREATR